MNKAFTKEGDRDDDDADVLWQKVAGVPASRIFRLDEPLLP